ncbi:folate-binding protein [Rhizobiales bacterium RZME27]|uniref:Folate-binding protein n=1 Tax=Endobacterium cereale TaxID=2663029 RepID=A0A6A8A383_9HYPH|nr:folate-binding protein YgfZ [Endobacterium cereale]MEB2846226.1 folate-binding protein YgfZ [Endobacterium cereale]MQY45662.1 folate-binding protein [Endobacterium cereale]
MPSAFLSDRALLSVTGKDAEDFLHNLITTDIAGLPEDEARPGALLTPQGKILFDFVIWRVEAGFAIEIDHAQRDAFARRLTMYKLRAAVDITMNEDSGVTVAWHGQTLPGGVTDTAFAKAGIALQRASGKQEEGDETAYQALRITAGLAVSGHDFALQDAFPHDVLLDKDGGLSFRKGCYVGQEVVSRMQHRGTARRRVVIVSAAQDLPAAGTDILAGSKPVGTLGSTAGGNGLAIVRIDRVGDALASGVPLTAADIAVSLTLPEWSGLSFPTGAEEAET